MSSFVLTHLDDAALLHGLRALVARERAATAAVLAHIAEVDARKLYLPSAYPSMFAYCVHELRLSEDSAFKRIRAARTARQFPAIFDALAQGRLHLSSVVLLTPYLTAGNVDDLLPAAEHKSKSEIEQLIAGRFPRSELLTMVEAIPGSGAAHHGDLAPGPDEEYAEHLVTDSSCQLAPGPVEVTAPRWGVAPIAPERYVLQVTIGQGTHDKLRYAQELLGHEIPSGEIGEVLDRALDLLVARLEKRKFAAASKPRQTPRPTTSPRHVPADVKRAVWERDGGRCTFVGDSGRRCPGRAMLEFDHIEPVARDGRATVENMRLRCRAHNQYTAECTFGAAFMEHKRCVARRVAEDSAERLHARERAEEVIPYLRRLGFRADESRQAAAYCEAIPEASIEERVRRALSYFRPPCRAT